MLISLARGALAGLMVFVATTTGTAAAQAAPGLTLHPLSFGQSDVDATVPTLPRRPGRSSG